MLQRLWRWHFFAGLMVIPFAILLAISGAIYLFKPQFQGWQEHRINAQAMAPASQSELPAHELVATLLAAHPQAKFNKYTVAKAADPSVEIELVEMGIATTYWLNKYNAEVLYQVQSKQRLMALVKKFHGELLLGAKASYWVELMACWMIVLIITGLLMWLPKPDKVGYWAHITGLLLPALVGVSRRLFWRRLHGAVGVWMSGFVLILLISGLPWTQVWGGGFKQVQQFMGWTTPAQQLTSFGGGMAKSDGEFANAAASSAQLSELVLTLTPLNLPAPVTIQAPKNLQGQWTVRAMPANRSLRRTLHYQPQSLQLQHDISFNDYHFVRQLTGYGIALHEGALFGWLNQLLGLLAALAVVVVSISGGLMWWRRRPSGQLAAPVANTSVPLSPTGWGVIVLLSVLLPLMGFSLLLVLIAEQCWQWLSQAKQATA